MALELQFSGLSFSGAVDQHTGNLSIFDLIEELRVPQLPINLPPVTLSIALKKTTPEAHKGGLFIHIKTPDGNTNMIGNGDLSVPAEQRRMKALFRFGGLPINQFGTHQIILTWVDAKGETEGNAFCEFDVLQAPAQPAPGQRGPQPKGQNDVTH
jgi:hypothetical protein